MFTTTKNLIHSWKSSKHLHCLWTGYGIAFDRSTTFSFPNGGFGQNVIFFGVDMSYSAHGNNKKKGILFQGCVQLIFLWQKRNSV